MSRIGKLPVQIPSAVKANISGQTVLIEGPKGKVSKTFDKAVTITLKEGELLVDSANNSRLAHAMRGTARAILANMVKGVQVLYSKDLEIVGVGFKAILNGKMIDLALGYSHPIKYEIPEGIKVTIVENTKLKIEGVDKHLVGQVAADIKHFYPVEPYKGKGVRIVGQYVRRKEGKKTA
ncbi:MAG: 50S ribosomal protein L6 [Verrucomicrobia bacterium GWF2_51_19]|nr:MAG: 50S ribosomal protein L6 [Verrucomicrobia bacterium GWF2_51_19]HCJ12587.1 50S ribosomal protein L6 [Opitutae bacterium]